jgi:alpha-ketoglutarate-dependent taurine dioxygenase
MSASSQRQEQPRLYDHVNQQSALDACKAAGLTLRPISNNFGVEVCGVDLGGPLPEHTAKAIESAFLAYELLLFRGQSVSRGAQVRFTAYFGELELPINLQYRGSDYPEVHTVSNLDENGNPTEAKGLANPGNFYWHTDGSYLKAPPSCTVLYGHEIPLRGGDTHFASAAHAYETLDEQLRQGVEGKYIVHSWAQSRINSGSRPATAKELRAAPPVKHPLVRTHPMTARKALFMGNHSANIAGMDEAKSRTIMGELLSHATKPAAVYSHQWRAGDLVMIDNRCLLHSGSTDFDMANERRVLHRTVLTGSVPV